MSGPSAFAVDEQPRETQEQQQQQEPNVLRTSKHTWSTVSSQETVLEQLREKSQEELAADKYLVPNFEAYRHTWLDGECVDCRSTN